MSSGVAAVASCVTNPVESLAPSSKTPLKQRDSKINAMANIILVESLLTSLDDEQLRKDRTYEYFFVAHRNYGFGANDSLSFLMRDVFLPAQERRVLGEPVDTAHDQYIVCLTFASGVTISSVTTFWDANRKFCRKSNLPNRSEECAIRERDEKLLADIYSATWRKHQNMMDTIKDNIKLPPELESLCWEYIGSASQIMNLGLDIFHRLGLEKALRSPSANSVLHRDGKKYKLIKDLSAEELEETETLLKNIIYSDLIALYALAKFENEDGFAAAAQEPTRYLQNHLSQADNTQLTLDVPYKRLTNPSYTDSPHPWLFSLTYNSKSNLSGFVTTVGQRSSTLMNLAPHQEVPVSIEEAFLEAASVW